MDFSQSLISLLQHKSYHPSMRKVQTLWDILIVSDKINHFHI